MIRSISEKDKAFFKSLLTLSPPIILQGMVSFGVNYIGNFMVRKLGDRAIAGIYLGSQVFSFLRIIISGIEGIILVLGTQYWGQKDLKGMKTVIAIGTRISLTCGVVFFIASFFFTGQLLSLITSDKETLVESVPYLRIIALAFIFFSVKQVLISAMRSAEEVKIGLYITIFSLILSTGLNYAFIFGRFGVPKMGTSGAALAVLISHALETAAVMVYVFKINNRLCIRLSDFFLRNKSLFRDFIKFGMPIMGQTFIWFINTLGSNAIIGRMSTEAIAAVSISSMLFSLTSMSLGGMSTAVGIIIGKLVGAGKFDLVKRYTKLIQLLFPCIGVACAVLTFSTKWAFISLYDVSEETVKLSLKFLNILSFIVIGTGYHSPCLHGVIRAGGDTRFVFALETVFILLVVLPTAAIAMFLFQAPDWVVFICLKSDQVLKCIPVGVKVNRLNWLRSLTRDLQKAE